MRFADRLLTIVVTATLTSAVWIVAGGSLIENAGSESQRRVTRPSEAQPSPKRMAGAAGATATSTTSTDAGAGVPGGARSSSIVSRQLDEREGERTAPDMGNLMIPVLNVRPDDLTDTFSDSRGRGAPLHEAIDIMAPEGTSVVAAAPGRIEKLFQSKSGGNTIYIRSSDGQTIYYYAHLQAYAPGLKEGQRVRRGQRIGGVGSTGNASRNTPHLHFAVLRTTADADWWEPANGLNPYRLLTGSGGN